jgi:hypothetical protein
VNIHLFKKLHDEGLLSTSSLERIHKSESSKLFNVFWEIRMLLYAGVLLLATGVGIIIYKNIDTIGHQVILASIALLCTACFYYCIKRKLPFSATRVDAPNSYFDYILLLGCLTFLTLIAYLQTQYTLFGQAYGLATFIPMLVLFFCAYYFDHLGILSLAITNLAAWMGIAITPLRILDSNNFANGEIIFAGITLGTFLTLAAHFSEVRRIKSHFSFTYLNFGINIFYISILAGMFYFDRLFLLWLVPLAVLDLFFYRKARSLSSFYIALLVVLYSYIGLSYCVVRLLDDYTLTLLYFVLSGIASIMLLMFLNKNLKQHARV